MSERFDVVVVGAGPAGTSTACALARAGLEVALFERGEHPGSKNMFGGVLYGRVLQDLIPNFWESAPVERPIARRGLTMLSGDASASLDFRTDSFTRPPYNGFTVSRPRFDRWFAEQAVAAGALLVTSTTVDDLIRENGRVTGVIARRGRGEVRADVVVIADGANSLLAEKAGLRVGLDPRHVGLGAKEIVGLPRRTIAERFNLSGEEGAAMEFVGSFSQGVQAGGFIYTNRESLSVGVVANLASLKERKASIVALLDAFKGHPAVRPLLEGGVAREYSAHLVPEAGAAMVPRLFGDGVLAAGDAAGLVCATGISLEGANYAIGSGLAAAEAILQAKAAGDFSARRLGRYETLLRARFVLKDLEAHRSAPNFLANPRLYTAYPEAVCAMLERLFSGDGRPKKHARDLAREALAAQGISLWELLSDTLKGGRAL